jgi:hypothetical protein
MPVEMDGIKSVSFLPLEEETGVTTPGGSE